MLTIEKTVLPSVEQMEIVIEGMRNPLNSWAKSDSRIAWLCNYDDEVNSKEDEVLIIGEADNALMMKLAKAGSVHAKYRRMLPVWVTLTAPLYFLKELDTYKVGTVANSCSTMHKITERDLTIDDFSHEHLTDWSHDGELCRDWYGDLEDIIDDINFAREKYLETNDKKYWWQIIQLLPSSYNQKRTLMLNYEVLAAIYRDRKNHKLDEWHAFCDWIESLPNSEIITGDREDENEKG